jgi:integrase
MSGKKRRGRGEGTIEELKSGHYRVSLSLGFRADGTRRRVRETFKSKQEAVAWRAEQITLANRGQFIETGKMATGDWLEEWLAIAKPSLSHNSWVFYDQIARNLLIPQVGTVPLVKLTAARIEKMYADLLAAGVSVDAVRKAGTTLGVALQKAVKNRLIPYNPARDADKPKPTHAPKDLIRVLDPDQVAKLLAAARSDRLYALYVVWLDSGAREGELFALTWDDIDWAGNAIRIVRSLEESKGKLRIKDVKTTGSRRRVALSAFSMSALAEHRKAMLAEGHYRSDAPVFCAPEGGWLRKSNFQRRSFNKALKRAGLPHIRPYDLRHSSASLLLLANESPKVVSERLGHSTVRLTLDTYSHVLPGMQERAATKIDAILRGVSADWPTNGPQEPLSASG